MSTPTMSTPTPPPASIPLEPLVYFRLKARLLELHLQEQAIREARLAAFRAASVSPGGYDFDDSTLTITPFAALPTLPLEVSS